MEKKLNHVSDLSELFMAIYALNNIDEEEKVSFSTNFKSKLETIIDDYNEILMQYNFVIYEDDQEMFDKDGFFNYLKKAKSKKYFADEFKYNLVDNKIYFDADKKSSESIMKSYDDESVSLVSEMVDRFEKLEKEETKEERKNKIKRNYISLKINAS